MSEFSDRLNLARGDESIRSVAARAAQIGHVGQSTLYPYFRDQHPNPTMPVVVSLAMALKVSSEELRQLAGIPPEGQPWMPPVESRFMSDRQRRAVTELIRSFVQTQGAPHANQPAHPADQAPQPHASSPAVQGEEVTPRSLDEQIIELLRSHTAIDPSIDLVDSYLEMRRSIEPILDTEMGMQEHLRIVAQVAHDSSSKLVASEVAQNRGQFTDPDDEAPTTEVTPLRVKRSDAEAVDRVVLGALRACVSVDPSVDFVAQYQELRRAIEPVIGTSMGMLAHLNVARQVLHDARAKLDVSEVAQNYGQFLNVVADESDPDAPPDVWDHLTAARKLKPDETKGQPEHGWAGGEENQDGGEE